MKTNWDAPIEDVRIEIIPLIDVIFCILTFFILAAVGLTRQSAINVDLPTAETGSAQMREMLIVSVDPIGQLYLEQQPITQNQLLEALQDYSQASPEGLVVVYASRSARYDDVVNVLDLVRSVGGNQVALATLPETGEAGEVQGDFPEEFDFEFDDSLSDPFGAPDLSDPLNQDSESLPELTPAPGSGAGSLPNSDSKIEPKAGAAE